MFSALHVSPGLMLRPSLSGHDSTGARDCLKENDPGVAGADAPAFVERQASRHYDGRGLSCVSPGLMLRPSLSVLQVETADVTSKKSTVSPGLMLRPSLSGTGGSQSAVITPWPIWCRRG